MGALIAAGVISAAGAAAGGYMAYQGSKEAAAATSKTSSEQIKALRENQARLQSALAGINTNIKIPDYSLLPTDVVYKTDKKGRIKINKKTKKPIIKEQARRGAVAEGIEAANLITKNTLAQVENLIRQNPADIYQKGLAIADQWQEKLANQYARIEGAYPLLQQAEVNIGQQIPQLNRAREIVSSLAEGDLTERQLKQLAQVNAEMVGATYNPEPARRTAGFQVGQAQFLEATRQASEERQRYGLSMVPGITQQTLAIAGGQGDIAARYGQLAGQQAQLGESARGWQNTTATWMDLARSWAQPTTQLMGLGLTGRAQDIEKKQFAIQAEMQKAAMIASGGQQTAMGVAQARNAVTGANLATQMALSEGIQGVSSSLASSLSGYGGAYNQYATAANASTTPMSSGFYRGQIGAANAYGVAPSQVRQYGNQGWSLA